MVKLYLDADVDPLLARELRARGYDTVSAGEIGKAGAADPQQLLYAAGEGRALLTFNVGHFRSLYEHWWTEGRHHAGIIVSRQYKRSMFGELLRLVENVFLLATEEDLVDRLRYLSEFDV